MENKNSENENLLKSQGLAYTQKSKKLEDATSSSYLFIIFGIIGILAIVAVWLNLIPLQLALYMKILYTIVLGAMFCGFIAVGIYYTKKIKVLRAESATETQQTEEIVSFITSSYSLDELDSMISLEESSIEQQYFQRYEKISSLIQEKYSITNERYLDYLIEKIYQIYSPTE